MSEVKLSRDYFDLFALPHTFAMNEPALESAYKTIQSAVHPDRFVAADAAAKRMAMQWATLANEAYRTLKDPVARASWLCAANGVSIDADTQTQMPVDFLTQQMEWREALAEARGTPNEAQTVERLGIGLRAARAHTQAALALALDEQRDFLGAAPLVRQLMFLEKFGAELNALSH